MTLNLVILLSLIATIRVDRAPQPGPLCRTCVATAQDGGIGIFVTVKFTKNCEHKLLTLTKQKICVTSQPIMGTIDFAYITEIKDLAGKHYFNLAFSDQGYIKLKKLSAALPGNQFALAVNNTIVGFIKNADAIRNKALIIDAASSSNEALDIVHEQLKKSLPVRKG